MIGTMPLRLRWPEECRHCRDGNTPYRTVNGYLWHRFGSGSLDGSDDEKCEHVEHVEPAAPQPGPEEGR